MLRCAITDRSLLKGTESQKRASLADLAHRWAEEGIELIQLREKDLGPLELAEIAKSMADAIAPYPETRLLVNNCLRAAIESRAHGVHLPSNSVMLPDDIRRGYANHALPSPMVTASCHSLAEIQIARSNGVDAILFAPVFGKIIDREEVTPAAGLDELKNVCEAASPVPVLALGGVTAENTPLCLEAGAAGIAGIRLFFLKA